MLCGRGSFRGHARLSLGCSWLALVTPSEAQDATPFMHERNVFRTWRGMGLSYAHSDRVAVGASVRVRSLATARRR